MPHRSQTTSLARKAAAAVIAAAFVLGVSTSFTLAGECSRDIDLMQARVDARIADVGAAGGYGVEGDFALMDRQPTPASVAAAERRLNEVSPRTVIVVRAAMVRAREQDKIDHVSACEAALGDVRTAIGP